MASSKVHVGISIPRIGFSKSSLFPVLRLRQHQLPVTVFLDVLMVYIAEVIYSKRPYNHMDHFDLNDKPGIGLCVSIFEVMVSNRLEF